MQEMLEYMYTGKAPNLDKMADDLLSAADKVGGLLNSGQNHVYVRLCVHRLSAYLTGP